MDRDGPRTERRPPSTLPEAGSKGVVVKKGRHRRFEEARSLKRAVGTASRRCPECGAEAEDVHASWCLAEEDQYDRILGSVGPWSDDAEHDPLDD